MTPDAMESVFRRLKLISRFSSRHAGAALEKLLDLPVNVELVTVELFPPEKIEEKIHYDENSVYPVSQKLYGQISGDVCLILQHSNALLIADLLLNRLPETTRQLKSMEESVISEVTNIVTGSFLTGLSIATDFTFLPSVPKKGIPDKFRAFENKKSRKAIFVEVNIAVKKVKIEAEFIFVAEAAGMKLLIGALEQDGEKEQRIAQLLKESETHAAENFGKQF